MSERRPIRCQYDWTNQSAVVKYEQVTSRPDTETALIIDRAIVMKLTEGLKRASEYLEEQGVPLSMAMRVLLYPAERRVKVLPKQKKKRSKGSKSR